MRYRFLLLYGLLAGSASMALANPIDPDISIDADCCSTGIAVNETFVPVGGGGFFRFENDTGSTIIELILHTTLSADEALGRCFSGFFLNCSMTRGESDPTQVTIDFFGVNPPGTETEPPCDTEFNEFEGIPVVQAGCNSEGPNPGHFAFNLNPLGNNGWTDTFTVTGVVTTPEPSTMMLMGMGLLLSGLVRRRK